MMEPAEGEFSMPPFNLGDGPASEARKGKKKGNDSLDAGRRQSPSKY